MGGTVQDHYASEGIAARILAALRAVQGADVTVTADALAPLDHFHGRGLKATQEMAALLAPEPGERLLDIGGGIGGPARWLAARFGCHVTSLDVTPAFCRAAEELNAAAGLAERVRVVEGSATALPFEDAYFDRAYSENVAMNIADKPRLFAEAFRVLRPGGTFYTSYLCLGPNGEPYYPVPWAADPSTSFLTTPEEAERQVAEAGFEIVVFRDKSNIVLSDIREMRRRIEAEGFPVLGMEILMGERMRTFQRNMGRSAEDGRSATIEVLARRPL